MYTTLISPTDLKKHHADPNWAICDCRFDLNNPASGRSEYGLGHIPHAVYVHLDHDLSTTPNGTNGRHPLPSVEDLIVRIEALGIDNATQVIVYDDDGGGYAVRLWWSLRYLGHPAVAVLDGGLQAWIAAGFELSNGDEQRPHRTFRADVQVDRLITVDQLIENLYRPEILLLDSRAPERFKGEVELLDPVAGRIPGAENRFWRNNLNTQGSFKAASELHAELEAQLGGRLGADAIVYCGSGVTSCHNIVAFVHAGFEMPRLYAGAWSEWCSDPSRGVETGETN